MRRRQLKNRVRVRLKEVALRPLTCPVGTGIFIVGLSGLSGDVAAWQRAIDNVTRDERVLALAERAAAFGDWVNQPVIRIALVMLGTVLILWRLPWFWRLRHKLLFNWRRLLADEVWIDSDEALEVLRNSEWGQTKAPISNALSSFAETLSLGSGPNKARMFRIYLEMSLAKFEEYNTYAVREVDGEKQYEQGALTRFARKAIEREAETEFGKLPWGSA